MAHISVIMPVYNAAEFLSEAIESILNQTYRDFEFIIVNDGSSDTSESIIHSYKDERILYVKNERNLGLIETLNKATLLAKGDFVARMDADDIALPHRLDVQLKMFEREPEAVMVCSPILGITPKGKLRDHWPSDINTISWKQIRSRLPFENCISHPTILIRTAVLKSYLYAKNQKGSEDWDLWLRLARDSQKIVKTEEVLVHYRIHPASVTQLDNAKKSPQLKSIKVKRKFIASSFLSFRFNSFVVITLMSILKDYQYYLRKQYLPVFLRRIKWFFSLNPFRAFAQYNFLKKAVGRHKSNVFLFFPYSHLGGAEKVHGEISKVLEEKQPFVFFTGLHNHGFIREFFSDKNLNVQLSHALHHPFTAAKTAKLIKKLIAAANNPVVFGANNLFFEQLAPQLPQSVFVVDLVHDITYNDESFYSQEYISYVTRLNKRVFISHAAVNRTREFYQKIFLDQEYFERLQLVYNYVPAPLQSSNRVWNKTYNVIYCGRDTQEKRTDRIFQLAEKCTQAHLDATFTLVGDIKMPSRYEGLKNIKMRGLLLDSGMLSGLYSEAHFVLITSDSEGFPLSLAEGMMHGCIPLSTPVGDIPYHIQHKENGFLSPENSDKAVDELFAILKNASENDLEKVSAAAQNYARNTFKYENFRNFYLKLFGG